MNSPSPHGLFTLLFLAVMHSCQNLTTVTMPLFTQCLLLVRSWLCMVGNGSKVKSWLGFSKILWWYKDTELNHVLPKWQHLLRGIPRWKIISYWCASSLCGDASDISCIYKKRLVDFFWLQCMDMLSRWVSQLFNYCSCRFDSI